MRPPSEWTRRILCGRDTNPEEFARVKEIVAEIQADALREREEVRMLMVPTTFLNDSSPLAD
jgi:hypothetical protein